MSYTIKSFSFTEGEFIEVFENEVPHQARSQFVREAMAEKLVRDGFIDSREELENRIKSLQS